MAGRRGAPRVKHPHRPKMAPAPAPEQDFHRKPSQHRTRRLSKAIEEEGNFATSLSTHFLGISATFDDESKTALVAIAVRDSVYLLDFSCKKVALDDGSDAIADHIISEVDSYERVSLSKFIGAGLPSTLYKRSPTLCSKLWLRLDVIPVVLNPVRELDDEERGNNWNAKGVDEQADSMARKCIMTFGPSLVPILQVGYRGIVNVDSGFHTRLLTIDDFKSTCGPRTWDAMMKYVNELKGKGTKIAFFSSTPQGGGVALMRHALVRLAKTLGLNLSWYVPKPKPGIFRITKTIHNILQGVARPDERISEADKSQILGWIEDNAERYWFSEGGPLRKPEEGGADVIMIDDPQMPGLIPLIKKLTPERPVLFRSHIQIRSDLVAKQGSPQEDVWEFLWSNIQKADMFISHPIPSFVPHNVPREKVAYLPAATDWLDGLNKPIDDWSQGYYGHLYNEECHAQRMTELKWPGKKYIVQIARFDPAKGIPDVVEAYAEFIRLLNAKAPDVDPPQLVICGNSSIDDPDGTIIYDETMNNIETRFPKLLPLISVMRLNPNDQLLNTLLSASHIVLQLSTREGFEVKVSEAIHKGKPVIATLTGGIPLQVQHEQNGFLVDPGDWKAVAKHLLELWTNEDLYEKMSQYALHSVSDEVGTVGNALSWFYLACKWANGEGVRPEGKWVNDLAREEVGFPYVEGETKLPRSWTE